MLQQFQVRSRQRVFNLSTPTVQLKLYRHNLSKVRGFQPRTPYGKFLAYSRPWVPGSRFSLGVIHHGKVQTFHSRYQPFYIW